MKLAVISHKLCWWRDGCFVTTGGFPRQIAALAELFDSATLLVPVIDDEPPAAAARLDAALDVVALAPLSGTGLRRRLRTPGWWRSQRPTVEAAIDAADAVHTPVPGDLGSLAMRLASRRGKRLFVRHCGTWGARRSLADRWLFARLKRIAGGETVVMATGAGERLPEPDHPAIEWIFATSLTGAEMEALPPPRRWSPETPPRLVSVGRLSLEKNTAAAVSALAEVRRHHPGATLDIVGDGPERQDLAALAATLDLAEAVTLHGNVAPARVLEILGGGQLFVFPTRSAEGFPKAVVEALACGLPVVAPPVAALPELVAGRGTLLASTDPAAVAAAVVELLASPERLFDLAQAAQAGARRYTLERWQETIGERLRRAWGEPLVAASGNDG